MKYLLLAVLMSACGGEYRVKTDPVTVNHNFNLNFEQVFLFCDNQCRNNPDVVRQRCVDNCFTKIVNLFSSGLK